MSDTNTQKDLTKLSPAEYAELMLLVEQLGLVYENGSSDDEAANLVIYELLGERDFDLPADATDEDENVLEQLQSKAKTIFIEKRDEKAKEIERRIAEITGRGFVVI